MEQLTLELDEEYAMRLSLATRVRRIDPSGMTTQQVLQVLIAQNPKWRTGMRLRRGRLTAKVFEVVVGKRPIRYAKPRETREGKPAVVDESDASISAYDARAKRLAAIMSVHGMWKDDPDKPRDAVAYQREVRAEWP
jgi:hypothetical protein